MTPSKGLLLAEFPDGAVLTRSGRGEYWVTYPNERALVGQKVSVHLAVEWVLREDARVVDGVLGAEHFYVVLDRARARQSGIP